MNSILSVKGLRCSYRGIPILRGIDFDVPTGSIFGYLGKNGAGKSTTIKLLLGLLNPDGGEIIFKGVPLRKQPLLLRSHTGSLIEHPSFYPFLTVSENLNYLDKIFKIGKERKRQVLSLLDLEEHVGKKAQVLSSGLKQRLGLAMCIFRRPEMLILDEPLNALDPQGICELRVILRKLNQEEGVTIFLSSHILEELEKIATQVAIIKEGAICYQGNIKGLVRAQSDIVRLKLSGTMLLKQLGYSSRFTLVRICDSNQAEFEVRDESEFAHLISSLCADGISIYDVTHKVSALENAFIHLTK